MLGLTQTSGASASLLLNVEGVLTAVIAWLVFKENADRQIVLGMIAIVAGVIESAVNAIPGIDFVASTSQPGVSQVVLQFDLSKNIDVAFNEVQAKVNTVLRQLPDDADPPVVAKVEFGADPVLWLALLGNHKAYEPAALTIVTFALTWVAMGLIDLVTRGGRGSTVAGAR